MRERSVVIVESPAKAKTINKYLGSSVRPCWPAMATSATCRPRTAPCARTRTSPWTGSVDDRSEKRLKEIAKALSRNASHRVYLATDPDREGEAISWHVPRSSYRRKGGLKRSSRSSGSLQRGHQERRAGRHRPSARPGPRADRRLSGAPRARLSGWLHPVAGAVAQAAGLALRRPRAIGGAEADLRARGRDRGSSSRASTGPSRARWRTPRPATPSPPGSAISTAGSSTSSTCRDEAAAKGAVAARSSRPVDFKIETIERKQVRRNPFAALHHLDPAAGGLAQARLRRQPDHARRPEALRGHRPGRRARPA